MFHVNPTDGGKPRISSLICQGDATDVAYSSVTKRVFRTLFTHDNDFNIYVIASGQIYAIINKMVEPIFDYQFRLILIGDSTVGKSSLLKYFTDGNFSDMVDPTVGVDFFARLIEVQPGVRVKLQLWDTAGQERFRSITRSYYRNSVGVLLVYDICKRSSFEHLEDWLAEAKFHIESRRSVYMVVGHKADMEAERVVSAKEGKQFADFHNMRFIETSAKTGQNVEEAFLRTTKDVFNMLGQGQIAVEDGWDGVKNGYTHRRETFSLAEEEPEGNRCC